MGQKYSLIESGSFGRTYWFSYWSDMSRSHYWIWCPIMGPILGGLFGAFLYDAFLYTGEDNIFAKRFAHITYPKFWLRFISLLCKKITGSRQPLLIFEHPTHLEKLVYNVYDIRLKYLVFEHAANWCELMRPETWRKCSFVCEFQLLANSHLHRKLSNVNTHGTSGQWTVDEVFWTTPLSLLHLSSMYRILHRPNRNNHKYSDPSKFMLSSVFTGTACRFLSSRGSSPSVLHTYIVRGFRISLPKWSNTPDRVLDLGPSKNRHPQRYHHRLIPKQPLSKQALLPRHVLMQRLYPCQVRTEPRNVWSWWKIRMRCLCVTGIGPLRPGRSLKSLIGVSFFFRLGCKSHGPKKLLIEIEITDKGLSGSEDDEEDEDLTPRRRKRAKAESNVLPSWQNNQELARWAYNWRFPKQKKTIHQRALLACCPKKSQTAQMTIQTTS